VQKNCDLYTREIRTKLNLYFKDNLIAALPDVIGSTIGETIARGACFVAGAAEEALITLATP
jgi:hypothetical protein